MTDVAKRARTAVVTGAGRGIGRATAEALALRGLDVALVSRSKGELEVTRGLVERTDRRAVTIVCDVSRKEDVEAAARASIAAFGAPDVIVLSAGIVRRAKVHEMTDADWDSVLDVNLKGAFLVTRAYLPSMLEKGRGRIIALASISSTLGTARQSAYAAAKWGLVGFIKSLAEELRGTGLASMAVMPGSVSTAMLEGSGFEPQMTPEEVAGLVVYAALDAPSAMNGSAIEMFGP
jgi:3-oxoacyl-[acyl-carrier protein] reductase